MAVVLHALDVYAGQSEVHVSPGHLEQHGGLRPGPEDGFLPPRPHQGHVLPDGQGDIQLIDAGGEDDGGAGLGVGGVGGVAVQKIAQDGPLVHQILYVLHRAVDIFCQSGAVAPPPDPLDVTSGVHGDPAHIQSPRFGGGGAGIGVQVYVLQGGVAQVARLIGGVEDGAAEDLPLLPVRMDHGQEGVAAQGEIPAHDLNGLVGLGLVPEVHAVDGDAVPPHGDEILAGPGAVLALHLGGDHHPALAQNRQAVGVQREVPAALAGLVPVGVLV